MIQLKQMEQFYHVLTKIQIGNRNKGERHRKELVDKKCYLHPSHTLFPELELGTAEDFLTNFSSEVQSLLGDGSGILALTL